MNKHNYRLAKTCNSCKFSVAHNPPYTIKDYTCEIDNKHKVSYYMTCDAYEFKREPWTDRKEIEVEKM